MTMTTILGRYLLQNELGAGGMGTVYLGVDTRTQQPVAIKQLKSQIAQPHMIERFRREGEALRELNHPNIVKMLDTVEENGEHFLVMEYISSGDLNMMLRQNAPSVETVMKLSIEIADALTRAHHLNIIHRDLKPANVLIAPDRTPRLTDFGVAYMGTRERVTDSDAIIGTIDYLSPEALNGDAVDARTDIWAFGVMLFEMLGQERPFKGKGIVDVIHAISTQPVPDLETLNPQAPVALVDLVYRMLEKDRNARIPSMRHVGAALEDILQGRASSTPPTPRFATPTPEIADRAKHNLPAQTTPFVGREYELGELSKLLKDPAIRLITILGPGGMGKTRLSLQAAQLALPRYSDGVYFVELAALSDPEDIVSAVAESLGFLLQGGRDQFKPQILNFLADQRMLLVLDNFEHLMTGASFVTEILQAAPEVEIIATSRQRLHQPGETLFHIPGMEFPEWETPEDALNYAAVKLFMNSARRARPGFEITGDELNYVARICRLVQGMPLGIVLASSWIAMLSLPEVASELQQGLDFLETDGTEFPERHRSIRAVMDYSWHQMTEAEQVVFMKLSVFASGFTREAAQQITGANLRILMSLVQKSHIRRDAETGRYSIHELLRQYALEQLQQSTMTDSTRAAHSQYFLDFLIHREADVKGRRQSEALKEIDAENENIKAAWLHAVEIQRYEVLEEAIDCLENAAEMNFRSAEAMELMHSAITAATEEHHQGWNPQLDRVNLRYTRWKVLTEGITRFDITPLLNAIVRFRQENALLNLSFARWVEGDYCVGIQDFARGMACYDECIAIRREFGDKYYMGKMLVGTFVLYTVAGQYEQVIRNVTESVDLRSEIGDFNGLMVSQTGRVSTAIDLEISIPNAQKYLDESMLLYQRHGKTPMFVISMAGKAYLALLQGDLQAAKDIAAEGIAYAQKRNYLDGRISCLCMDATCDILLGKVNQGTETLTQAAEQAWLPFAILWSQWGLSIAYCSLGDDAKLQATLKILYSLGFKAHHVIALPSVAVQLYRSGNVQRAIEILSFAAAFTEINQWMNQWDVITDLQITAKSELGANVYNAAWERGKSLELELVVTELIADYSNTAN